jgi:hypothetical protein
MHSLLVSETVMRRTLIATLTLLAGTQLPAQAQTCMGLASFRAAPVQISASAQFSQLTSTFGGSIGYGMPSSLYGGVGVSTTSSDGDVAHRLGLSARAGYQLELSAGRQIQVCPNARFALGMGPNDDAAGVDRSGRVGAVGVNMGAVFPASPQMKVVPNAGLAYAYGKEQAENAAGVTLFEISDRYALAEVGVGILLNSNISVRPNVAIPLGLQGGEPVFGLTLGYSFGLSR